MYQNNIEFVVCVTSQGPDDELKGSKHVIV
jgi:hypothetical protein